MTIQHIQEVLNIEKQAQAIHEAAVRDAEQMRIQAEKKAQALLKQARMDAQEKAHQLVTNSKSQEECSHILTQAEDYIRSMEVLAKQNQDYAVSYVLDRIVGRK